MQQNRGTVLFIGVHWPEPSTGAGTRMLQLINFFSTTGYQVVFASSAAETELSYALEELNVKREHIELNSSSFDVFISDLAPIIVVFDRFLTEEQFGWRVSEQLPKALRILDTEDLHSLRIARSEAFKNKIPFTIQAWLENDTTKREVASIYRCDMSLIISSYELSLLKDVLKIDDSIVFHLPFMVQRTSKKVLDAYPSFEERRDFMCIGNGKHAPNIDAVKWLKTQIWPLIHQQLPKSKLVIYGAYLSQQIKEMHQPKEGFYIAGFATDLEGTFTKARINLAPLRFGAGQKAKLLDAMCFGTPSITTFIGVEGMTNGLAFNGIIANDTAAFANAAVSLYSDKDQFLKAQQNGYQIVANNFDTVRLSKELETTISKILKNLKKHREFNFIGSLLRHQSLQSTKYMSKWIEEKAKIKKA
ncbi:glycosyltransferase family 4 protein [Cellulophaga sp. Hel_I_12]|uniref:glycosyltransferase family 4 protein n=1 Tax=Cellulophaga sp. Hel_I_12 TaxID=1249972 RepID=UPI0006459028|nr:glycosyltransferase family 4 protein [Cellulophaga sp. Hel_I_12]